MDSIKMTVNIRANKNIIVKGMGTMQILRYIVTGFDNTL